MSEDELGTSKEREAELWQKASQSEGPERARVLLELGKLHWHRTEYVDSLALSETARDLFLEADQDEYIEELTDANFGIMNNNDMLDRPREAAEAAGKIIELYRVTVHPMLGELLRDQGRYWFKVGEFQKSADCHLEGMKLADPEQGEHERAVDLLNLGMAWSRLKNYEEAVLALKRAIDKFKTQRDPKWVFSCHCELAVLYYELNMADDIQIWARKALDYAELAGLGHWVIWLNFYLGVASKLKEDFDAAETFLAKAKYEVVQYERKDWDALVRIEKELAGLEMIRGHVSQAYETLRRVATIEETLLAS